jgi:hypothetical protein
MAWMGNVHKFVVVLFGPHIWARRRLDVTGGLTVLLTGTVVAALWPQLSRDDAGFIGIFALVAAVAISYGLFSLEFGARHAARLLAAPCRRFPRRLGRLVGLHYFWATIPFVAAALAVGLFYVITPAANLIYDALISIELIGLIVSLTSEFISMLASAAVELGLFWVGLVSVPFAILYALLVVAGGAALARTIAAGVVALGRRSRRRGAARGIST